MLLSLPVEEEIIKIEEDEQLPPKMITPAKLLEKSD